MNGLLETLDSSDNCQKSRSQRLGTHNFVSGSFAPPGVCDGEHRRYEVVAVQRHFVKVSER